MNKEKLIIAKIFCRGRKLPWDVYFVKCIRVEEKSKDLVGIKFDCEKSQVEIIMNKEYLKYFKKQLVKASKEGR